MDAHSKADPRAISEKAILVLETLLSVAFRDVQRNRLSRTQPLISGRSIDPSKSFRDPVRKRDVVNRETINIEFLVIEDPFGHRQPLKYDYG